jgi:hypothetical protein
MKNLISNTALGKHLDTLELSLSAYKQTRQRFDSFLLLNLEVWMFVPCDLDGNVLGELDIYYWWININVIHRPISGYHKLEEYRQAKERCLFDGFEKKDSNYLYYMDKCICYIDFIDQNSIEDLVKYGPKLTATALKLIGL